MAYTEAQKRATYKYREKNYKQINIRLPIELVDRFREKCEEEGIPQAQLIKEAIEEYLKK